MIDGIQSEVRVKEFGEVFTPDSIVNDMLDLVDSRLRDKTPEEYISLTYLEPACGDGQFLIRILDRKLRAVKKLGEENIELNLIKAVSSIYGIDIQPDNVIKSRERMLSLIVDGNVETFDLEDKKPCDFVNLGLEVTGNLLKTIKKVIELNIQCGDTLSNEAYEIVRRGKRVSVNKDDVKDLTITEYAFNGGTVNLTDYYFSDLSLKATEYGSYKYDSIHEVEKSYEGDCEL